MRKPNHATDLHGLIRRYGAETVAAVMGCASATLANKRSGAVGVSLDELYRLACAFGSPRYPLPGGGAEFDTETAVMRLGEKRS